MINCFQDFFMCCPLFCSLSATFGFHIEYVFSKVNGEPYIERNHFIVRLYKSPCVKAFNYHGIRGLCVSLLAEGGVAMKDIQHILMHSNMTTTDRYIRRLGGTNDVLASIFDSFDQTKTTSKIVPFKAIKK